MGYLTWLTPLTRRAKTIQRTLGTRAAAGFLRNQGVGLDTARSILAGRRAQA